MTEPINIERLREALALSDRIVTMTDPEEAASLHSPGPLAVYAWWVRVPAAGTYAPVLLAEEKK